MVLARYNMQADVVKRALVCIEGILSPCNSLELEYRVRDCSGDFVRHG